MTANQRIRWLFKPLIFSIALLPFLLLIEQLVRGDIGADPLAEITNETGVWTLRFLSITLAITPLRRLTGWSAAIRFRRMIGLFAFFYGSVHLLIFVVADRLASLQFPNPLVWQTIHDLGISIGGEIYKRPYIAMGFASWALMLALALTSTAGMIRRLGGRRWQALHRLVYGAAIAGVVHYWWSVKADVRNPRIYAITLATLLAFRVVLWARKQPPVRVRSLAVTGRTGD